MHFLESSYIKFFIAQFEPQFLYFLKFALQLFYVSIRATSTGICVSAPDF